ncbi:hypothetical protein ACFV2X_08195 [Streptomyces sp. NPDC059679]|uniref:hypothetical protein n=1 Tax=Streptomyces sp. NPDC059679 TaxID=3346903 RepID=UPI00367FC07C
MPRSLLPYALSITGTTAPPAPRHHQHYGTTSSTGTTSTNAAPPRAVHRKDHHDLHPPLPAAARVGR